MNDEFTAQQASTLSAFAEQHQQAGAATTIAPAVQAALATIKSLAEDGKYEATVSARPFELSAPHLEAFAAALRRQGYRVKAQASAPDVFEVTWPRPGAKRGLPSAPGVQVLREGGSSSGTPAVVPPLQARNIR